MLLRTWLPYDWTPRSEAYFVFPLAQGTPGKQCGLAATGDYQPSLRSPWLAARAAYSAGYADRDGFYGLGKPSPEHEPCYTEPLN
ncbi:hypothetical protein [Thiolapillus sp.]|uniref:hypothetical protein n=1 Tax=Thiolapillus sp. TaxID=2017437 RepID=UPI003AF9043B